MGFYRKLNLVKHFKPKKPTSAMLHVHPERSRETGGRVEIKDPTKYSVEVVIVPMMDRDLEDSEIGQYTTGKAEMYIDREELFNNYGIKASVRLDYIEYNGRLYKLVKKDDYGVHTNLEVYVLETMPDDEHDL
ncbi:MAG: hypothetical protein ACXQS8_06815 [Candidatus Helarchaeales archaeon]